MEKILTCKNVCKNYGSHCALSDVNLEIEEGHIIGLLGPNGSGKTTLIKLIADLLVPTSGKIEVMGEKPGVTSKKVIAYLPDESELPSYMKISELIDMYKTFFKDFDESRAHLMIESLSIDENERYKNLSKGTKEKVQLILTMSRRAKIYLLDEPIAGVDPAARDYILKTILSNYSEDSTVILSTHLIQDVENILDQAIFIKDGRIHRFDSCDAIREETNQSLNEYFKEVYAC